MATAVLALGITSAIIVMQRGLNVLDTARNITTAGQIMASQMEQIRMQEWATISTYESGPTPLPLDTVFTDETSAVGSRFRMTRSVATPQADMRQITLTMTWKSVDGHEVTRSMTTYYCRYGIRDYIYNGT